MKIPFNFWAEVVRDRSFEEARVLITSKMCFGASFGNQDLPWLVDVLGAHEKTVRKYLGQLVDKQWLGYDKGDHRYFNRKFEFICQRLPNRTHTAYRIHIEDLTKKHFKAFAIATTYDQLIASQQYQLWNHERIQEGTSMQSDSGWYYVANSAFASIYGLDESTASRDRKLAKECGYLDVRLTYSKLPDRTNCINRARWSKYGHGGLMVTRKNQYIQNPALVKSNLKRTKSSFSLLGKSCKDKKRENSNRDKGGGVEWAQ